MRVAGDEIWDDFLSQARENLRIAEKAGDIDQQILGEEIEFCGIFAQPREISGAVVEAN